MRGRIVSELHKYDDKKLSEPFSPTTELSRCAAPPLLSSSPSADR